MTNTRKLGMGLAAVCTLGWSAVGLAGGDKAGEGRGVEHEVKMMDTNNDGQISAEEHAAGAKTMFETMDANKDGKVTAEEMTAAHEKIMGKRTGKTDMGAADKIKAIDTNNDGTITAEEHAAGAKMMFDKMDENKDGQLSKAELTSGHKMMHKDKAPKK